MYVVIVYDVSVERVNRLRKYLKQYMNWVQNSVFEGELTPAEFHLIKRGIKDIVDEDVDSVLIYHARNQDLMKKEHIGIEKNEITNII